MAQHGRYKIIRRVADGGMAEIFLATQLGREGFAKPIILKRIHSTIYADPQFRNMFIDEAHISMSLSHSNIAQVLDLGVSAGRYFLALELVDGWDLGRVLHRAATAGVRLPRELALHVTAEVCRALAYAHAKAEGQTPLGIVHRDVSPHNILLSDQGEVKLTDFGIAKAMNKREHTGTGVVKGKVAFMSPEQAMGKPIDQRSDLFSVGTVLYLMVTRSRPFEGPSDLETLLRVQKGDFRPPEETAPDLPPEVAAVVARAMRKEPGERYQSADEMLGDVERVLRTAFRPVGQTELKRWLTELSARDGVPPISQSTATPARATSTRTKTGTGELEEEDVVLLDTDEEVIDGEEATSLAVVKGGGDLASARHAVAPHPARPAGSRGRRIDVEPLGALGVRAADPRRGRGTAGPPPRAPGQWFLHPLHRRVAGGGRLVRRQVRPDVRPDLVRGRRERRLGELGGRHRSRRGSTGFRRAHRPTSRPRCGTRRWRRATRRPRRRRLRSRRAEPAAAHEAGHETVPRRHGGERSKDFVGRDLAGLKMAPDPSLLPAPTPPSAPKAAESPPSAPPASENP